MSEKPRLKDSDEILNSIGKKPSRSSSILPGGASEEPAAAQPPAEEEKPVRRRARQADKKAAGDETDDPNPLDFQKYDLPRPVKEKPAEKPATDDRPPDSEKPKRSAARKKAESGEAKPASRGSRAKKSADAQPPETAVASAPENAGDKEIRDYVFPTMTREELGLPPKTDMPPDDGPMLELVSGLDVVPEPAQVREYAFEEFADEPEEPVQEKPAPKAAAPAKSPKPKPQKRKPKAPPVPEPEPRAEDPRRLLMEDEESYDTFLKDLSARFEHQFSRKFEGQDDPDAGPEEDPSIANLADFWKNPAPLREQIPEPEPEEEEPEEEDFFEAEADSFMNRFVEEIQEEEQKISEEFKDTLAEKFMRERERYLRELGIAKSLDSEEPKDKQDDDEEPAGPPRRRLDFQIQPEMHVQEDSAAPAVRPVTYSRFAQVQPQVPVDDDGPAESAAGGDFFSPSAPQGKKSAEQLLQELAEQTRAAEERLGMRPVKREPPQLTVLPPVQEPKKKRSIKKLARPRNIVIASAVVAFALLVGVGWNLLQKTDQLTADLNNGISAVQGAAGESLTVYESRNPTERMQLRDLLVKRGGVTLSNISVGNLLVISDVEVPGAVTLRNISVDGAIHVKNCAANELDLTDVSAERVVISNSDSDVTVRVSGATNIGTVEIQTPARVEQTELSAEALGVRNVVIRSADAATALNTTFSGMNLPSLASTGEAAVNLDGTMIENMTADGSILLNGTGRVVSLSVSALTPSPVPASAAPLDLSSAVRPMALTATLNQSPLSVVIKGVEVMTLNVRSPANLNIASAVDTMSVSDNMVIGGGGSIGVLMISERFGNARLLIDLAGVNILNMTTEAETRINAQGTTRISSLTCNASTYALGNRVNNLIVNSDNVIYENEPDKISVTSGIRPPQTMADNPNLDYSLSTAQNSMFPDAEEDDVSTTCSHPRESGGFVRGDGSAENPFQVSTPAQLAHVGAHLNSHFTQTQDIDIADDSSYSGGFGMIAGDGTPFSGSYNGNAYQIKNLRIVSDRENTGLFGENTGVIRNVNIASGEISSTLEQSAFIGGIAGFSYDAGQIISCSNRARINARSAYAGGIVGYNYGGKIRDCYNAAKITADGSVGGIVGVNRQNASVAGCYNVGTIEGDATSAGSVAGVNEASIANCYYLEDSAEKGIGSGEGSALVKTSQEMRSAQMVADLIAGDENSLWVQGSSEEGYYGYPVFDRPASATEEEDAPAS